MAQNLRELVRLIRTIKLILVKKLWKYEDYILLIGTEDFGNLGDHQIAESEIEFIKYYFKEKRVVEIPASKFYRFNWGIINKVISKKIIVFITGGGNWGNDYMYAHNIKRKILKEFPYQCKIVFPVTINYTDDEIGREELFIDKKILNDSKVLLAVRDKKSYENAKENFPTVQIYLMPDIVLFSNKEKKEIKRTGCVLCLRNDKESVLSENDKKKIEKIIREKNIDIIRFDTQYKTDIGVRKRKNELKKAFEVFNKAEFVVTDRLHGMIFSYITGTNFIAFENKNKKNKGAWDWLGNGINNLIVNDIQEFEKIINKSILYTSETNVMKQDLKRYYDEFFIKIKEKV